jgi:transcriptional regulator with XRE-family HTH domain
MIVSYPLCVDIRSILSHNIKAAREALHITQATLAIHANISLPYLVDIERRRTWVSDKTLENLARALGRAPWELLRPLTAEDALRETTGQNGRAGQNGEDLQIAELITKKRELLCHATEEAMNNLLMELIRAQAAPRTGRG